MTGTYDEADYLSTAPRRADGPSVWMRLALPILIIFLVAGGIAAVVGISMQEQFEAEVEIELLIPEGISDDTSIPLRAERITAGRSGTVATRAVTDLSLLDDPRFLAAHPELDSGPENPAERRVQAATILLRNTGAQIAENSSFATVSYRAADPTLAADVANGLAEAFVAVDLERLAGAAYEERAKLEGLIEEVRSELQEAERVLAESGSDEGSDGLDLPAEEAALVAPPAGDNARVSQEREALESQLRQVRTRLNRVEGAIARGGLDSGVGRVAELQEQREELEEEYARVTAQFRDDYPAALDLRERIDVIDAALSREAARLAEDRAAEARQLRVQEADIRARIAALGNATPSPELATQAEPAAPALSDAEREVQEKRELYSLLLARLATVTRGEVPLSAQIVGRAVPPTKPVAPDWRWIIGIAIGSAGLLSVLLIVRDFRRRKLA